VLKSLTPFVGGGGPRFWDSVSPEARQLNHAEVMIETTDKRDTSALVLLIQAEISRRIAGARVDTVTTVVTLREKPLQEIVGSCESSPCRHHHSVYVGVI
jgi:hypothetical protein